MNKAIDKKAKRLNGNNPKHIVSGNYVVCIIKKGRREVAGIAKCNPNCDIFDEVRGKEIAFRRAVKQI